MTDTFARDARAGDRAGMSRRQLLRAGAWAAPVLVLATAVPAAAASNTDQNQFPAPTTTGTVPGDRLTGRLALWNENSGGTPGPIGWNGQIGYWTNVQASDPATGTLPYVLAVQAPGSTQWQTVVLGAATMIKNQGFDLPNAEWGDDVMTRGTYTFRLAAVASDGLKILGEQTLVL